MPLFTHSAAEIVQQFLLDQALGTDPASKLAWPCFIQFMPDDSQVADNALAVYATVGTQDGRCQGTGEVVEHQGIQVRVRSRTHAAGWTKAKAIADALDANANGSTTIGGTGGTVYTVNDLARIGTVLPLGKDPNDSKRRHAFTLNYLLTATEV